MIGTHRDYHLQRAEAEERKAELAADPSIARAHRELAALHRGHACADATQPAMSLEGQAA